MFKYDLLIRKGEGHLFIEYHIGRVGLENNLSYPRGKDDEEGLVKVYILIPRK
jgi:hypothetical protein